MQGLSANEAFPRMQWGPPAETEERFRKIFWSVVFPLAIVAAAIPQLPRILMPAPPAIELPPRVVQLQFYQPPPPPPPPPVAEPPRPQVAAKTAAAAPAPRRAPADPLAALSRELALLQPSAPMLTGSAGLPIARGVAGGDAGNASVLSAGTTRGSGGIGDRAGSSLASGDGVGLRGHGTTRVGAGEGGGSGASQGRPGRSSAEINAMFERHRESFTRYYRDSVLENPALAGGLQLVLALTIEPDGRISACEIVQSTRPDAKLEPRIVELVKSFRLSSRDLPRETTRYTLHLLPT